MIYIFLVVFLYLFFGAALYFSQRKILFNKSSRPRRSEDYGLENINEIIIKTDDNVNLLAWHYKGKKNRPILVYFHGNSFDIGERAYRIKKYNDSGFSTLIVSGRGLAVTMEIPQRKIYILMEKLLLSGF